jgi:hypothetical protein
MRLCFNDPAPMCSARVFPVPGLVVRYFHQSRGKSSQGAILTESSDA